MSDRPPAADWDPDPGPRRERAPGHGRGRSRECGLDRGTDAGRASPPRDPAAAAPDSRPHRVPAPEPPMGAVLRQVAAAGPFFAVRTDPPGPAGPRSEGYLPLGEVYAAGGRAAGGTPTGDEAPADCGAAPGAPGGRGAQPATDPPRDPTSRTVPDSAPRQEPGVAAVAPLRHRVEAVAAGLPTAEHRVAASLVFQGLAARLWSLGLGPAALCDRVPDMNPAVLWWNPARTAPDDLWLPGPPTAAHDAGTAAGRLRDAVLRDHLEPLHRATVAVCRVSGRLLWGNAASALAGTLRVWDDWCRACGRSDAADRAVTLTGELCATEPLRSTGTWTPPVAKDRAPAFRRHSCCLYYRVPGGGLCGDCGLRPPEAPSAG